MNFFNKGNNFQFNGMDDFINQINQRANENNKDDFDLNDIDDPELKRMMGDGGRRNNGRMNDIDMDLADLENELKDEAEKNKNNAANINQNNFQNPNLNNQNYAQPQQIQKPIIPPQQDNKNNFQYVSNQNDENELLDFLNDKPAGNNNNNNKQSFNQFNGYNQQFQNNYGNNFNQYGMQQINNKENNNLNLFQNPSFNQSKPQYNNFNFDLNNNNNTFNKPKIENRQKNEDDLYNFLNDNINDLNLNNNPQNNNPSINNNKVPDKKEENKPPKIENKQPEIKKVDKNEINLSPDNIIDLCPEQLENKYHNIKFMDSISVLTEEIKLMEKISELYKKSKDDNDTYEVFDNKKGQCENRIELINRNIENGIINIVQYSQQVKKTINLQKDLLKRVDTDKNLKFKEFIKKRINDRLKILEKEYEDLKEAIKQQEEEGNDEEEKEEEKKEEKKKEKKEEKKIEKKVEKKVEKKEEKKKPLNPQTALIEDRLEDYQKAKKYFEDNDMPEEQIKKADKIIKILELSIQKINEGKSKEIDIEKLPKDINYEFIYGMTTKERNEIFMEVLKDLKAKEKDDVEKLQNMTNGMKGLSANKIKKEMSNIRSILDNLKENVKQDEFNFKVYSEAFKNKWCPAPIVEEIEREVEVPISNKNIAENILLLKVNNIQGIDKKNFNVSLVCKYDTKNTFNANLKKNNIDKYETSIKIEKSGMKHLWKKNLVLTLQELYKNKILCCSIGNVKQKDIGYLEISFHDFKTSSSIENDFEFTSMNKKEKIGISINIKLQIREPLVEKEFKTEKKMSKEIMKVFQPFKGPQIQNYDIPSSINIANKDKFKKKKTNQSKNTTSRTSTINKQQTLNKNPTINKTKPKLDIQYTNDDFKPEELVDPSYPDIIVTVKSLEYEMKKLDEKIAKIEGRTPKELRDKKNKMFCKKNILENMLGDQISPSQYANIVKDSIDHHRKLQKYFQDKNEISKEKIVTDRINVLIKEMNELLDLIQGQLAK